MSVGVDSLVYFVKLHLLHQFQYLQGIGVMNVPTIDEYLKCYPGDNFIVMRTAAVHARRSKYQYKILILVFRYSGNRGNGCKIS